MRHIGHIKQDTPTQTSPTSVPGLPLHEALPHRTRCIFLEEKIKDPFTTLEVWTNLLGRLTKTTLPIGSSVNE